MERLKTLWAVPVFAMMIVGILGARPAVASPPPAVVDDCSALRVKDFSKVGGGDAPTKVMSGKMDRPNLSQAEATQTWRRAGAQGVAYKHPAEMPANCLITGYVSPHIQFEMRMPEKAAWNGKFLLAACDGFCGKISFDQTLPAMVRGYAVLTTDGGHWGEHPFDAIWANDNVQGRIDFAYRANHVLLLAAKAIMREYYGQESRYNYITGCSKGGQAGIMAAIRYPGDFDGIISRAPTIDYTGVNVLRCGTNGKAPLDQNENIILDASKVPLIQRAVMNYCDPKDGLADGSIADARMCDFKPSMMLCKDGQDPDSCLTAAQVGVLDKIYSPVRNGKGEIIYPAGTALGSEVMWPDWVLPLRGQPHSKPYKAWDQYLRFMAFRDSPGPMYDPRSFSVDDDWDKLADMSTVFDIPSHDLRKFQEAGGKIIIVHGWGDAAVSPVMTIKWYDEMTHFMGGRDKTQNFARLFLMPGVTHCGSEGPGPSRYDALTLLENWVEKGEAPNLMMSNDERDGKGVITRTRPVYPYPLMPRYKGKGSVDDAANFGPYDPKIGG